MPRIAQVGVTVSEANAASEAYKVVEVPFGQQNEWVNNREKDAAITYIFDKEGYLAGAASNDLCIPDADIFGGFRIDSAFEADVGETCRGSKASVFG